MPISRAKPLTWFWKGFSLLIGATLLLYGALAWRTPEADAPLKIAIGVWPGSETLVYGRETGMFSRNEVQLVEMAWSSAAKVAFANRVVDAAVLSLDEVVRLRDSYHDLRVVLVMDFSNGADAIVARPPLDSVASLKGKRIGVERQSVGTYLLANALDGAGMALADVEIVPMNVAEMEVAYKEGELDAFVAGQPWLTRLEKAGAVNLYDSSQLPGQICRVLAVRTEVLERRRRVIEKVAKVHLSLYPLLREVPDNAAMETVCRRLGVSRSELRELIPQIDQQDLVSNLLLLGGDPPGLDALANKTTDLLLKHNLVLRQPASKLWLEPGLVEDLK